MQNRPYSTERHKRNTQMHRENGSKQKLQQIWKESKIPKEEIEEKLFPEFRLYKMFYEDI